MVKLVQKRDKRPIKDAPKPISSRTTAKNERPTKTSKFKKIMASPITPVMLSLIMIAFAVVIFIIPFSHTETKTEDLSFITTNALVKDQNTELGDSFISHEGAKGIALVTYKHTNTLFDLIFRKDNFKEEKVSSNVTKNPENEVITQGSKKYQYMYCSNGLYRYYTDEQFKDANTGFTHKSKDYCAENNEGTMTYLADAPPGVNNAARVAINPSITTYKPTNNTSSPPVVNPAVYTDPNIITSPTQNPLTRQECRNKYEPILAYMFANGMSGSQTNKIQGEYDSCLSSARY